MSRRTSDQVRQLRLPADLIEKTEDGAERTGLSQNDVIKQSIRMGLPFFLKALLRPEELPEWAAEREKEPAGT